jgi:predicted site-specific integrase-resolvase
MLHSNDIKKLANKKYFTVSEAAYILGVTPLTLRNWDNLGKLKARRNPINNYRIYKFEDIETFINRMDKPRSSRDII